MYESFVCLSPVLKIYGCATNSEHSHLFQHSKLADEIDRSLQNRTDQKVRKMIFNFKWKSGFFQSKFYQLILAVTLMYTVLPLSLSFRVSMLDLSSVSAS